MLSRSLALGLVGLLVGGCTVAPAGLTESSPPATTPPSGPTCLQLAQRLSRAEQIGQLLMMGIPAQLNEREAMLLTEAHIGSVLLLGALSDGADAVRAVTARVSSAQTGSIPVVIAADQEGGVVQRLSGPGFDTIPAAIHQGELSDADLTASATEWAHQLHAVGVRLNLAPVADVVETDAVDTNAPIGRLGRGFGSDPALVSGKVAAFIAGMHAGGVATSVKHFPGLGAVGDNTDFASDVVDTRTTVSSPTLDGFRAGIAAGTETLMVSSATYLAIDPDHQAVYSPLLLRFIRDELGFAGVIITDDLGVAEAAAGVPVGERAAMAVRAGADLVIDAEPETVSAMAAGLTEAATVDDAMAQRITASAGRVLALKARIGLVECRAS